MHKSKGELQIDRFVVPYRVYGEGDKAVICVSGAQQTMAAWRPFIQRFGRDHAVVVFDAPGLGRSRILRGSASVSLGEQLAVLNRLIKRTAADRERVLCAASWGTIVSATYAARYPQEVDRMILGSFGLRHNRVLRYIIEEGRRLFEEHEVERAGHLIIEEFGQRIHGPRRAHIISQFEHLDREQARTLYHHLGFVGACGSVEDLVDLGAIRAPTLVINGADDPLIDPQDAYPAAARMQDADPMIVENAGHFLHLERPELVEIYAQFIEERGRWAPATAPEGEAATTG